MKRLRKCPQTYHEWRALWHSVLFSIGHHETIWFAKITRNAPVEIWCPDFHKVKWKLLHQAERIHNRMEVEQEAKTESWSRAMFEAIFDEDFEEDDDE